MFPTPVVPLDALGRTPISEGMKRQVEEAFGIVPEGKRGALLLIADEQGARAVVAAKLNGTWKVAGGLGVAWEGARPTGWVGVIGAW